MLKKSLATHAALGLLLLSIGCGDDAKDKDLDDSTGDGSVTGVIRTDGGPSVTRPDGGRDIDGGADDIDASLDGTDPQIGPDGAILPGTGSDAGGGGNTTPDTSSGLDAAVADAGTTPGNPPVTTTDAATPPGDAGCTINDPSFGCGTAITPTWVRFNTGYEYDRDSGLVWAPPQVPTNINMLSESCFPVEVGGVKHIFDIPMMDQVRTLAAGCAATTAQGACQVQTAQVATSQAGTCTCAAGGAGPHATGGFCRPEVGSCETLWTRTYCGPNDDCPIRRGWFYDVSNGSIVTSEFEAPLAKGAKFRCVSRYIVLE